MCEAIKSMGHPDRRSKRELKKKLVEEALDKKSLHGNLDLTPYNAIKKIINSKSKLAYK
ncbi:MAG: hypothetical protein SCK28_12875 [Bacillota bacterium]|nr:hypothetical protein [Bacillota bacterium]